MKTAISDSNEQGGNTATYRVPRTQRLRSNRTTVSDAIAHAVTARGAHSALGEFNARVLDLSIHGARLALQMPPERANQILLGDQLQPLTITCNGEALYVGAATVARAGERAGQVELGIELSHAALDLEAIYRFTARQSARKRWEQTRDVLGSQEIPAAIRAWVTEVEGFLRTAQHFLDREEAEIASWDRATREAISEELLGAVAPDVISKLNVAMAQLTDFVKSLPSERQPELRAFVQSHLNKYLETAPFIRRAKQKPLGYAGDYEMMNMLYRDHREGDSLFAKSLNMFATQVSAARANINRIDFIGEKLRSAFASKSTGRLRVASIGCGPAQEICAFLTRYPELGHRLDVALIDQEERALAQCERVLAPLAARTGAKVRVINDSARRLMSDQELGASLGECDLIYSAGLFDYLNERAFGVLLGVLYKALVPGGTLLIGNVAFHNPDRGLMEYVAEWFLHHRTPEQLYSHASSLLPLPQQVMVEAEPSGVNLFIVIQR